MRGEDYDVTDFLAGLLNFSNLIEEEMEESEVVFDDHSFFEPVPSHEELS